MNYIGDFPEDYTTVTILFTTHDGNGAPVAPLTAFEAADVTIYKNGATAKATTNGVTMTSPLNSKTGLHAVIIDTSNDTGDSGFWTTGGGSVYSVVLDPDTETVNSQTVRKVVGSFGICVSPALRPTTAGRTLDVSATGEAGLDWANVGSPTTTLALTGTTIAVTQKVDVDTIKTNPVANGGTVTFPTNATLASTTNITAGTVTTATNVTTVNGLAAGVITATSIAADAITDAKVASDVTIASVTGAVGSVTARVTANTDQLAGQTVSAAAGVTFPASVASPTNITAGTITTVTNLTNAPTSGDFTSTMKTSLNNATPSVTVSDKTGFALTSAYDPAKTAAQAGDAMALTSGERTSTGTAVWATTTRLLTAGTNIVLAKGTGVTGFNDIAAGAAMTLTAAYDAAKNAATQTSVDAIKSNTDSLTFGVAGILSVNVKYVNDIGINGSGTSGDPWGP